MERAIELKTTTGKCTEKEGQRCTGQVFWRSVTKVSTC